MIYNMYIKRYESLAQNPKKNIPFNYVSIQNFRPKTNNNRLCAGAGRRVKRSAPPGGSQPESQPLRSSEHHLQKVPLGKGYGVLKWWYSTTTDFPTKSDHFGVFWGYHHFRKPPYGKSTVKPTLQSAIKNTTHFFSGMMIPKKHSEPNLEPSGIKGPTV